VFVAVQYNSRRPRLPDRALQFVSGLFVSGMKMGIHTGEFFEPAYFFENQSISAGKTAACHVFGAWQSYECD
jgi:hypothetical protein